MKVLVKPQWRPKKLPMPVAASVSLCLFLVAILPLLHQAVVLAIAVSLQAVASSLLMKTALMHAGLDPVYASVFNRTLGNIEARGLAVAGPLGDSLHQLAPSLFASPDKLVPGASATALVGDGGSVLASAIAMVGTEVIFMCAGLAMLWFALRRGRASPQAHFLALSILGLMFQARGVVGLARFRFSLEDLEIMGLSHVFTKLFPVDAGTYRGMVAEPLDTLVPYLIPAIVILIVYGVPLAVILLHGWLKGGLQARGRRILQHFIHWPLRLSEQRLGHAAFLGVGLMAGIVLSQALLPTLADYNYASEAEKSPGQVVDESPPAAAEQGQVPVQPAAPMAVAKRGPSKVAVSGAGLVYNYTVDGQPEKIRGIGYNVMYSHLSPDERAARYDRDFGLMQAAGVNTILGWEREQFDELTLEKAQEYGIGVVMPYHLKGDADYTDPTYQQEIRQDVTDWVRRFKKYPALRMWGIGNEVVHSMGKNPLTPRSRAFSQFYVNLADAVRAVDPDHPITYRDAEDLYLGPLRDALRKDGVPRPWLVYGVNFFTLRICDALQSWPKRDFDSPVIVSEFAPSGLRPEDRPKGYIKMLKCIAKENPSLLGAFAYVWATTGPEAIDRVMGLVNQEGQPVDQSLTALGKAYRHNLDPDEEVFRTQD